MPSVFKKVTLLHLVILALLSAAVFANTLANDFVWDDNFLIVKNYSLRDVRNIPLFFTGHYGDSLPPSTAHKGFRPIVTSSFALDYLIWGLNPRGYHLTNLLLHVINVLLVYWLVSILAASYLSKRSADGFARNGSRSLAFITAFFFALHPIHTESVSYIKNRSDLFAFLFIILALLFFHLWLNRHQKRRIIFYAMSLSCFVLALGAKAMALSLPLILLLYLICFSRDRSFGKKILATLPFLGLIPLYLWFREAVLPTADPGRIPFDLTIWSHLGAVLKTLGWYLKMLLAPVNLNADHVFLPPYSLLEAGVLWSAAALLLTGLALLIAMKHSRLVFFGLGWIMISLIPVSNIVYLYSRPMAEQRLYIPSLGFCLLLALGIQRLFLIKNRYFRIKKVPWIPYAAILIIGTFYAVATVQRNFVWHDWLTLFSDSVAASPDSARVRNNFGLALAEKGLYEQARRQFEAALQLYPDFAEARNNLGTACLDQGKIDEAITHFQASLGLDPEYAMAHKNLGVAWREKGDVDKALSHFRTALGLRPAFPAAHFHLGLALLEKKDYDRARHHFRRALEIDPDYGPAAEQLRFYRQSR